MARQYYYRGFCIVQEEVDTDDGLFEVQIAGELEHRLTCVSLPDAHQLINDIIKTAYDRAPVLGFSAA